MPALVDDIRGTVRALVRQPRYTTVAVLVLTMGIAANATVFTVLDTVLWRELPYPDVERLAVATANRRDALVERKGGRDWNFAPLPRLLRSPRFAAVAVAIAGELTLGDETAVRVRGAAVSEDFFATLGVRALVGRLFSGSDGAASGHVVVISERLWAARLNRAPDVVGRSLRLNGRPFVVIGVLSDRVQFPDSPDVWIPSGVDSQLGGEVPTYEVVLRVRDGVSLAAAREEAGRIVGEYWPQFDDLSASVRLAPLRAGLSGSTRPVLLLIGGCAVSVLLVSCLNIAGLLSIRVSEREGEFAIRRAIGARWWHLARHVWLESCALSAVGALMAIPATVWMVAGVTRVLPRTLHGAQDVAVDVRALAVTALLALLTALLAGAAPALPLLEGRDTTWGLSRATVRRQRSRLRAGLVVVQIAAALALLAGAVTVVRHVAALMAVDLGVRGDDALVMQIELPRASYRDRAARNRFHRRLEEEFRLVPGVRHVGSTGHLPGTLTGLMYQLPIALEGRVRSRSRGRQLAASPDYFAAIGIDVLAGRSFRPGDTPEAARVAVASVGVARLAGLDPRDLLGRRIDLSPAMPWPTWAEIVGIVGRDVRLRGAEDEPVPIVYVPFEQALETWSAHVVVRGEPPLQRLAPLLRVAAARVDAAVPLYNVRTFDDVRAASLADRRLVMVLMLALGGIAIGQAAVGLYGVMSHAIQSRTREIGIRMAVGASPARVQTRVLLSGSAFAAVGIIMGTVASFGLWRIVSARVVGVGDLQSSSIAAVGVGVLLVALAAAWLPARRATRVDPVTALRG